MKDWICCPTPEGLAHLSIRSVDLATLFDHVAPGLLLARGLDPENLSVRGIVNELTSQFHIGQTRPSIPFPTSINAAFNFTPTASRCSPVNSPLFPLPHVAVGGTLAHNIVSGIRKEHISLDADLSGFLFPDFQFSVRARFASGFSGPYAGCENLRFDFRGMSGSDFQISLQTPAQRRALGCPCKTAAQSIWPPCSCLRKKNVADLFRESPQTTETASGGHLLDDPRPQDSSPEKKARPPLPEIRLEIALDRIHLAREREIGTLHTSLHLVDGWPRQLAFALTEGENRISLSMGTGNIRMVDNLLFEQSASLAGHHRGPAPLLPKSYFP